MPKGIEPELSALVEVFGLILLPITERLTHAHPIH